MLHFLLNFTFDYEFSFFENVIFHPIRIEKDNFNMRLYSQCIYIPEFTACRDSDCEIYGAQNKRDPPHNNVTIHE